MVFSPSASDVYHSVGSVHCRVNCRRDIPVALATRVVDRCRNLDRLRVPLGNAYGKHLAVEIQGCLRHPINRATAAFPEFLVAALKDDSGEHSWHSRLPHDPRDQ